MEPYHGLAQIYDSWMAHYDYDKWASYLLQFLSAHGIASGAQILDIACGTGQIALRLAQAGYRVTACDASEEMLEQAASGLGRYRSSITLIHMDIREIALAKPVPAITCTCDGVNYLTNPSDVRTCFSGVYKALLPGGIFLFDISSYDKLTHMDGEFYGMETEDAACLWQNTFDPVSSCITMDLSLFLPAGEELFRRVMEQHVQRAHTEQELTSWLKETGFSQVTAYDCFTLQAPKVGCERIQFVAVK